MPYDILQGVKYDPRYDDQNFALIAQGLDEANKRYNIGESSISDALSQYGSIPAVSPDRPVLAKRLDTFKQDINELVNKKYAGDYGAASKEIARRIKQEQPYFAATKQRYDEYQKISPLITELRAKNQLIETPELQKALTSATIDEQGNIQMPSYQPVARPEYGDIVYNDIGKAIDQMVSEGKIHPSNRASYLETITTKGLDAITNPELRSRIESYIPEFEAKTPFGIDPLMQEKYQGNTKQFIEDAIRNRVSRGLQRQPLANKEWELQQEQAEYNRRKGLEQQEQGMQPKLTSLYSTAVIGEKQNMDDVSLTDPTFKGQIKRELIKSRWKDNKGNLNPSAFAGALAKYTKSDTTTGTEYSLSDAIVKDKFGQTDVDATMANIEKLAGADVTGRKNPDYTLSNLPGSEALYYAANNFLKDMNTFSKQKVGEKFGDYGTTVIGFDLTDKNSAQVYSQMNDYINQISPDVFNFETGKFAETKTNKLSKNKDFITARQDNKFKIQGVIETPDGVKFIAEDGTGEPQVVSSNSDVVNKNLLRMFANPTLIANYSYRNYKLSPSGNTVWLGDQKTTLPEGYTVERESDGRYSLFNKDKIKSNRSLDKWEILHSFGFKGE